ncbi:hypothetical protein LPC08_25610 (plasmid) [Roseomonas sp. OT10]|uniref:hypothetical protein n=1 Tax=Roseomonas cutis TaxID=2897332 RepID=UPI001E3500F6|nr:hypothetical protein [Roseomonas sp. OT10]UFN51637.1 hypothetical protein LPC08_25610 [Roseomonas sp. OT10]
MLQAAYRDALSRGSPLICLADGQVGMLDPEPGPSRVATYHLLDDADAVIATVTPPNGLHD